MIRVFTFYCSSPEFTTSGYLWAGLTTGLAGLVFVTKLIESFTFSIVGNRVASDLRSTTLNRILNRPMEYFYSPENSPSKLATTLALGPIFVPDMLFGLFADIITQVVMLVAGMAITFSQGYELSLFAVIMMSSWALALTLYAI